MEAARERQLEAPGLSVIYPRGASSVFTLSFVPATAQAQRTVHLDPRSGAIVEDIGWAQYSGLGKAVELGVMIHMGSQFGLANQLLLAASCAFSVATVGLGVLAWWRRRPSPRTAAAHAGLPAGRRGDRQRARARRILPARGCVDARGARRRHRVAPIQRPRRLTPGDVRPRPSVVGLRVSSRRSSSPCTPRSPRGPFRGPSLTAYSRQAASTRRRHVLIQRVPAQSWRASRGARPTSRFHTPGAKPYTVSCAIGSTSFSAWARPSEPFATWAGERSSSNPLPFAQCRMRSRAGAAQRVIGTDDRPLAPRQAV